MWRRWFAWRPIIVTIEGEFDQWVWLEYVERRWSRGRYGVERRWKYRPVGARHVRHAAYLDAHKIGADQFREDKYRAEL
jgi:hypothetical protein